MRVSDQLRAAKQLVLAHPARGQYAKDAHGLSISPLDARACTWCSVGALRRVTNDAEYPAKNYLNTAAARLRPNAVAASINDSYPELIPAMFDKAIELAEAEEGSQCQ